jgi:hypothetical protein
VRTEPLDEDGVIVGDAVRAVLARLLFHEQGTTSLNVGSSTVTPSYN